MSVIIDPTNVEPEGGGEVGGERAEEGEREKKGKEGGEGEYQRIERVAKYFLSSTLQLRMAHPSTVLGTGYSAHVYPMSLLINQSVCFKLIHRCSRM